MTFTQAVSSFFTDHATFNGRASRSEFWWSFLFLCIVLTPALLLGILGAVAVLALAVPSWAVAARRLHDIGKSGWWQLTYPIPLLGLILFLIWNCRVGDVADNRFGRAP